MSMFRRGTAELPVAWEQTPWWRSLSLAGWGLLALGAFATLSFIGGLVSGQVLLLLSIKAKSGPMQVTLDSSPFWFVVCMAINFAFAVAVWALFIYWLRERKALYATRR